MAAPSSIRTPEIVADASVWAAIVFDEPNAAEATARLDGAQIFAPHLLAFELTNIARTKHLRGEAAESTLLQALEWGVTTRIQWMDVDYVGVLGLAISKNLSAYDASYLWLARSLNAELVTFDQRLAEAGRE